MARLLSLNKCGRVILGIILIFATLIPSSRLYGFSQDESGSFSIFFNDAKVGYEEFHWEETATGYLLTVRGRMDQPVAITVDRLQIRLDRDYIPQEFVFEGTLSGMSQRIHSTIREGAVFNQITAAGQEEENRAEIRRDAFLLPNPLFSPFLIISKKFRCTLPEKCDLAGYIIPQMEVSFSLEPGEDPCLLIMDIGGMQILLTTNESGGLIALDIPGQKLRVLRN